MATQREASRLEELAEQLAGEHHARLRAEEALQNADAAVAQLRQELGDAQSQMLSATSRLAQVSEALAVKEAELRDAQEQLQHMAQMQAEFESRAASDMQAVTQEAAAALVTQQALTHELAGKQAAVQELQSRLGTAVYTSRDAPSSYYSGHSGRAGTTLPPSAPSAAAGQHSLAASTAGPSYLSSSRIGGIGSYGQVPQPQPALGSSGISYLRPSATLPGAVSTAVPMLQHQPTQNLSSSVVRPAFTERTTAPATPHGAPADTGSNHNTGTTSPSSAQLQERLRAVQARFESLKSRR